MVNVGVATSHGIPVSGMRDPAANRIGGCNHEYDPFAAADIGRRGIKVRSNRGSITVNRER